MTMNHDNGRNHGFLSLDDWHKFQEQYNDFASKYRTDKAVTDTRLGILEKTVDDVVRKIERVEEISIRLDERQKGFDTKLDLMQEETRLQFKQINDSLRSLSSTFSNIADVLVRISPPEK